MNESSLPALAEARILNEMQLKFVEEYLLDLNATRAAIRAGYSVDTAATQGWRLLKHDDVSRAIQQRRAKICAKLELKQEDVVMKLMSLAESAEMEGGYDVSIKAWLGIAKILGFIEDKSASNARAGDFVLNIYAPGTTPTMIGAKPAVTIEQRNG